MGSQSHWLPYVAVPDVDATVRHATSLGARTYVPPTDIVVGRFAVLADPQGAIFAIYKSVGETPGHDGNAKVAEFSWHELMTSDPSAAWDFYHALFGWDKRSAMDMGPQGVYQMFGRAGIDLGGIYSPPPDAPMPSHWMCYVRVPSVDKAVALIEKLGGRVVHGPMEVPRGSRIAMCIDPQGAAFAVHSVALAPAAANEARSKAGRKARSMAPARKPAAPAKKPAAKAKKKVAAREEEKLRPGEERSAEGAQR